MFGGCGGLTAGRQAIRAFVMDNADQDDLWWGVRLRPRSPSGANDAATTPPAGSFASMRAVVADPEALRLQVEEPLYWSLALGACLGGNGSLVGASANVVIAQIGHRNKHPIGFIAFAKYGVPTMLVTLVVASGYVWLRYL